MADISTFVYAITSEEKLDSGKRMVTATLTTAAGDYPTGGIPLSAAKLGFKSGVIEQVAFIESNAAGTHVYKYDKSANKIMVLVEGAAVYAQHANSAFTSPDQVIIMAVGW